MKTDRGSKLASDPADSPALSGARGAAEGVAHPDPGLNRRRLLRNAGASGLGLAGASMLPALARADPAPNDTPAPPSSSVWYPPIEPYEHGLLDVGQGNKIYWEAVGNPAGKPALQVHGGPGFGCSPSFRSRFDPTRYRAILMDQRGCGRSRPLAKEMSTEMKHNTTQSLISDIEKLREHLGIEKWLLTGTSWGATLMLAYAQAHPKRVTELVFGSVTMTRPAEIDWLYFGLERLFPVQWRRFRDAVPKHERPIYYADGVPKREKGRNLLEAYSKLFEDPRPAVRRRAAIAWNDWESATISLEFNGNTHSFSEGTIDEILTRTRICAWYFKNNAFLEPGQLLRDIDRIARIKGTLIAGRLDFQAPIYTAYQLNKRWPSSTLTVIENAGHTGNSRRDEVWRQALDSYAQA